MACNPFGTKPILELVLTYCELNKNTRIIQTVPFKTMLENDVSHEVYVSLAPHVY